MIISSVLNNLELRSYGQPLPLFSITLSKMFNCVFLLNLLTQNGQQVGYIFRSPLLLVLVSKDLGRSIKENKQKNLSEIVRIRDIK